MLILDGTIGSDICGFLARLQEETLSCSIMLYEHWLEHSTCKTHNHEEPEGIIYVRVSPDIAFMRLQKHESPKTEITLDEIKKIHSEKDALFIENKNNPKKLEHLSVLVLNGNIDFHTDFSQFYNHLFYIRRFIKQIEEKKEIALGIQKEKKIHRKCC